VTPQACLEMCYLRRKLAEQFADLSGADRNYTGDMRAFYFDISAEDVKLFSLKADVRITSFSF